MGYNLSGCGRQKTLKYYDVLPARNSGRKELELKELIIEASRKSDALFLLLGFLEDECGVKIEIIKTFDD